MIRRLLLPLAVIALVACGRDTVDAGSPSEVPEPGTAAPGTGTPGTVTPGTGGVPATGGGGTVAPGPPGVPADKIIDHPKGADSPILRLSVGGGFVPEGADFQRPPDLVVLGDGTVVRPGPQIEIFPGPLLPALTVAKLDETGIQAVLQAAKNAGLLAEPPAYDIPPGAAQIADAPGTTLELHADGQDVIHTAYALGFNPDGAKESTEARQRLYDFVTQLHDLTALASGHLSEEQVYTPERFGVIARPATAEELAPTQDVPAPETVPWPDGAGNLADGVGTCVELPAGAVRSTFEQANQLTRFTQAGVTYVVFVRALLPGESCSQFA